MTSEYISVHCPDLTNSFVYLSACHGLQDSVLAASLINKNCNVVVGYSDIVHCDYEAEIRENLITEMCTPKNTAAGTPLDYQSVQEAMDLITPYSRCGLDHWPKEESEYTYDTITVPIIFGNRDYRFAEAIADDLVNVSDEAEENLGSFILSSTYVSICEGETGQVSVQTFPEGYDLSDLIWTVDDDKIVTVNEFGDVYGKKLGHTRVTVRTSDALFTQHCFVNVHK